MQVIELQPEQLLQMTTETARASKMIVQVRSPQPLASKLANRREQPANSSVTDESSDEEGVPGCELSHHRNVTSLCPTWNMQLEHFAGVRSAGPRTFASCSS